MGRSGDGLPCSSVTRCACHPRREQEEAAEPVRWGAPGSGDWGNLVTLEQPEALPGAVPGGEDTCLVTATRIIPGAQLIIP